VNSRLAAFFYTVAVGMSAYICTPDRWTIAGKLAVALLWAGLFGVLWVFADEPAGPPLQHVAEPDVQPQAVKVRDNTIRPGADGPDGREVTS
jgi:hypothetical protein